MSKRFRPYSLTQRLLLPVDMREWLPEGHLALFIVDVVAALDLSQICDEYRADSEAQLIVAAAVTQQTNDKQQLVPMLQKVEDNVGQLPEKTSADAGYFSEANVTDERLQGTDLYVPPDRQKHGAEREEGNEPASEEATVIEQMRQKLKTAEGHDVYRLRKQVVEPVFGQIKDARGLRRFSFRGLAKVAAEWDLICLTHNLLKLFRFGPNKAAPVPA